MTDDQLTKIATEWFDENHSLFRLDTYNGIDLVSEIFDLLKRANIIEMER